ncbi:MAG: hypothetical protein JKY37_05820 [Nannocystaceae bacterium]|nr:hypothetical protein [Nannocystaceae bacterium]
MSTQDRAQEPAEETLDRGCSFTTFYSFKGGVGRSMALINVAGLVASRGFRVLVIDMDLEAPGLSYLVESVAKATQGFVDLLVDAVERGVEADLFGKEPGATIYRYTTVFELPQQFLRSDGGEDGSLRIMPAGGHLQDEYPARLERLNLPELYRTGTGLALVQVFKQFVIDSDRFDYVFIDSRTGFSDESGICTRDLPDYLMIFSGLNHQNVKGTTQFLRTLRESTAGKLKPGRVPLRLVLSPIPNGEDELVDQRSSEAEAVFSEAWGEPIELGLQIPYHPQLALTEQPHIFRRRRGYLFEAYNRIEAALLEMQGDTTNEWIQQAARSLDLRDYSTAESCLVRAGKFSSGDGWAMALMFEVRLERWAPPAADAIFARLLKHLPDWTRGEFAQRLTFMAHHAVEHTEGMYKRALQADQENVVVLDQYACFLLRERRNLDAADAMYERALDLGPERADTLGNYACLSLMLGHVARGLDLAQRALTISQADEPSALDVECWMYLYCCGSSQTRTNALHQLRGLVEGSGLTTGDWDFGGVIEQASATHPESDWLLPLAEKLSGRAPTRDLSNWPAWTAALPSAYR